MSRTWNCLIFICTLAESAQSSLPAFNIFRLHSFQFIFILLKKIHIYIHAHTHMYTATIQFICDWREWKIILHFHRSVLCTYYSRCFYIWYAVSEIIMIYPHVHRQTHTNSHQMLYTLACFCFFSSPKCANNLFPSTLFLG